MKKIECKYCGWSWNENEGGDDKYTCHMCGNDNEEHYLNESQEDKSINQYNKDGEKNGPWVEYYPNGKDIFFKGGYKNGKKDGKWVFYYMNGNIENEGSFKNDLKDGVWAQYYRDGNLIRKELYNNGEYVRRISLKESETSKKKLFVPRRLSGEDSKWLELNKINTEKYGRPINQYTHDGLKTGMWEEYFTDGQLSMKGSYIDNKKEGIWEEYDEYDDSIQKGPYKNGKKDGKWVFYYMNGNIENEGSFKDDLKDGIWEWYYSNGKLYSKGSFKDDLKDGIWEEYYENGQLWYKGLYKDDERDGIWEFYWGDGKLQKKLLYKDGIIIKRLPLNESETPKKKLFIPRRIDERYTDLLNSMITTDYSIETYLKNRDSYKELTKELDPLIMKLPKEQLIMFVKANPFWINSIDKVKHLLNTLNYKENKDIAENHIGQTFSKGNFYTTPELKYYENKLKTPQRSKVDTYVFVGSDEFVETRNGSYKKKFDIERLMKVSLNDWKDTSDYGNTSMIKMMMLRAQANNKQLYKITANKGLLDDYEGKTGSEIPEYILSAIDQKKERI
jgi:antitoxin component YwqK of YwqJK toxin-antitoxin module